MTDTPDLLGFARDILSHWPLDVPRGALERYALDRGLIRKSEKGTTLPLHLLHDGDAAFENVLSQIEQRKHPQ